MDSNSFLTIWGLNPDDFRRVDGPINDGDTTIAEAWEARRHETTCPRCKKSDCHVHSHYTTQATADSNVVKTDILIIHRIVYRCLNCGKTFTMPIHNVLQGKRRSFLEQTAILEDVKRA